VKKLHMYVHHLLDMYLCPVLANINSGVNKTSNRASKIDWLYDKTGDYKQIFWQDAHTQPFFATIFRDDWTTKTWSSIRIGFFLTAAINYTTIPKWFVTRHATAKLIIMVVKDSSSTYLQLASSWEKMYVDKICIV
jgi:hypothetical protein